jgi:NitT/TauT family transport system permease protein
VALVLWQVSVAGSDRSLALPPPVDVLAAFQDLLASGELEKHVWTSLGRLASGWVLGVPLGIVVGFAIGLSTLARSAALPLILAAFPIPKVALLPLFIVWFGIGEGSKIATIAIGIFPPMVIATCAGVDGVDRALIRMGQSFGIPTAAILRRIILPGAMPTILSGVQISTSIGILLLVAAEMIAADHGVGALVIRAGNLMRTDQLMVGVLLLAAFGLLTSQMIALVKRSLLRWR